VKILFLTCSSCLSCHAISPLSFFSELLRPLVANDDKICFFYRWRISCCPVSLCDTHLHPLPFSPTIRNLYQLPLRTILYLLLTMFTFWMRSSPDGQITSDVRGKRYSLFFFRPPGCELVCHISSSPGVKLGLFSPLEISDGFTKTLRAPVAENCCQLGFSCTICPRASFYFPSLMVKRIISASSLVNPSPPCRITSLTRAFQILGADEMIESGKFGSHGCNLSPSSNASAPIKFAFHLSPSPRAAFF